MPDTEGPFEKFGLTHAIQLRWALRDIRGKRLKLSPVSQPDLQVLIDLGLVEMQNDEPGLTSAGAAMLE